jgi:hypothetical protein
MNHGDTERTEKQTWRASRAKNLFSVISVPLW